MSDIHPEDWRKLQWVYDVLKNLKGDDIRWTGNALYIGTGQRRPQGAGADWKPQQFRVKSEENDYLVCVPYDAQGDTAGEREYKIAKVPANRGGDTLKAVTPPYVADQTIVWAAPFANNGATDGDDKPILLMELATGGGASSFWAKITASAGMAGEDNRWQYEWTEQQRTATGWQDLTGGRTKASTGVFAYNSIEANNDDTGRQGNGVDIDGTVFDDNSNLAMQAAAQNAVVRMYEEVDADGNLAYSFAYENAIDGECA